MPKFQPTRLRQILALLLSAFASLFLFSCASVNYGGHAAESDTASRSAYSSTPIESRPGLGTEFGEYRGSQVTDTTFSRSNASPARESIYYNDREGIDQMMDNTRWRSSRRRSFGVGSAEVTIKGGGWSRGLPGYRINGRNYVVGQEGSRYEIAVQNNSWRRIEAVVSVDGLDVIDGRPASTGKRGYVIPPGETMNIEGWRTNQYSVAAFRFGAVADSYATRSGSGTRNVGVIGVVVFEEKQGSYGGGSEPGRRHAADPFPNDAGGGRYAQPPRN